MKQPVIFFSLLLVSTVVGAQVDSDAFNRQRQQMREQYANARNKARQQYSEAQRKAMEEYAAFRKKANEEYAQAVQKAWTHMGIQAAEPKPAEPPAPRPPAPVPDRIPTTIRLPQSTVEPAPVRPTPQPLPRIKETETYRRAEYIAASGCKDCRWYHICHGGCLHDGFLASGDFRHKTFLCLAYKRLFAHIEKRLKEIGMTIE